MTLDIAKLRELLAAYQAHGGGLGWTHGELGAAIETSQSDEVHGGTLFAPTDDYRPEDNVWPEIDVAAARLACAAVNALPQLLAIAEAAGNLLARIHRDGGHYVEQHGYEKAFADAEVRVVQLLAIRDAAVVEGVKQTSAELAALLDAAPKETP